MMVEEILEDAEVQSYIKSDKFAEAKLPVQTAMCDNFKGWGNFADHSCIGWATRLTYDSAGAAGSPPAKQEGVAILGK